MANLSRFPGGVCLSFASLGGDPAEVKLYALGMPHDYRPTPPPGMHGETLGLECFNTRGVLQAEELCGGGVVMMRVGFVPNEIARVDPANGRLPGYKIPATQSWRLGSDANKADAFRLDRGYADAYGIRGVGFLAADSGFCQISVYHDDFWLTSYFIHVGFHTLAPQHHPQGISLIDAVVADIKNNNWGQEFDATVTIRAYYGMGICPGWYGIGDNRVRHVIDRYGDEADAMLRTPSVGPRANSAQSISLRAMLDAEFDRSGIKGLCNFEQRSVEGPAFCPAALRDTDGIPVLWSAMREADETLGPRGNPAARNFVFFTMPQ